MTFLPKYVVSLHFVDMFHFFGQSDRDDVENGRRRLLRHFGLSGSEHRPGIGGQRAQMLVFIYFIAP